MDGRDVSAGTLAVPVRQRVNPLDAAISPPPPAASRRGAVPPEGGATPPSHPAGPGTCLFRGTAAVACRIAIRHTPRRIAIPSARRLVPNVATALSRLAISLVAWPVHARLPRGHPQPCRRLRRRHGRHAGAVRPHRRGLRRPAGQVPRGADPAPARRHRGRPRLDGRGGRRGRRDRHVPGQPAQARRVGPRRPHARDQPQGGRDRAARRSARSASSPARSARPATCPPPTTRRSARSRSASSSRSSPSRRRASSRAAPTCSSSRPRRTSSRSRRRSSARARRSSASGARCRSRRRVSLLPQGGKMLLGTDIARALTTLEALKVDAVGLNCSTGPEDMRDAIRYLGEYASVPVHCIPNAGLPLQGPDGETIFPEAPAELSGHPRRVRRALRRDDRRRLLRHDARAHRRDRRALRRPRPSAARPERRPGAACRA